MAQASARPLDDDAFESAIEAASQAQTVYAADLTVSGSAVARMVAATGASDGRPVLHEVSFERVRFVGGADFRGVTFEGGASFRGCVFEGDAMFDGTTFRGDANFQATTWGGDGYFVKATFEGHARFEGQTVIHGDARFDIATFRGDMWAPRDCRGEVWFDRTQFVTARHFGPLTATKKVVLDGAVFAERVALTLRAPALSAAGTEFRSGADILLQSATVGLDGAAFGAASTLSSATRDTTYGALLADDDYALQTIPRVVSLRGARVSNLTLSGVDLRACRFHGAHGLDSLSLEQVVFAETPEGWLRTSRELFGKWWPYRMRWTRRLTVAEEHQWRSGQQAAPGWWPEKLRATPATPNWSEPSLPTPHQIAAVYRALRKGQESRNDAPGAADFYYGEMEMRRMTRLNRGPAATGGVAPDVAIEALPLYVRSNQDSTRRPPSGETAVLFLYWLVSGYGLRASRSLAALAVTIVCGALLLYWFGFPGDVSYGRSLLFALESCISLLRAPSRDLTAGGEVVTIGVRLLGPLFFGLALLALRGRVKR